MRTPHVGGDDAESRRLERFDLQPPAPRSSTGWPSSTRPTPRKLFFFDLPDLPEAVVHADHWHFFRNFLRDAHPAYTPEEIERYIEAWSQPGAATGMINYYRSSVRTPLKRAEEQIRPISAPTLVIWGERDRYLGEELAEPEHDDVPNLDRVERLPNASHWVHHDEPVRVTQLLIDFFAAALPTENR